MFKKDVSYRDMPFSCETPLEDFFLCTSVNDLYAKCESNKNKIIKIRTVGILTNDHGYFYIKEMNTTCSPCTVPDTRQTIQISVAHMKKLIRCSSMPYPVQLFGSLQWVSHPVIFAQIVQPLSVPVALLLHETILKTSMLQSHSHFVDSQDLND